MRDEIFAARVRKLSFNPLAGKSELRLDTFCVCLTCLKFVLIPLRGKVNCGLILALIAHTTVLLSFNPLAGKSELRLFATNGNLRFSSFNPLAGKSELRLVIGIRAAKKI